MRAVRIHTFGATPRATLDVVPDPAPAHGETLVRVEAAAVAHLDLTVASGRFGIKPDLPYIGGVEGCGSVVESDTLGPGTRVVLRGGGLGLVRGGTWAELVTVGTRHLTQLPDGLPAALGATYVVPVTTAHTALHDVGRLGSWSADRPDEVVLIAGAAGAVGSMAAQLARRAGATVLGLAPDDRPLPAGVERVRPDDPALARDRPATLLVDTLGGAGLAGRCRWVRPGGRAVLVGYVAGTSTELDLPNWLLDDVALLPINMMRRDKAARAHLPMLERLLMTGELTLDVEAFAMQDASRALHLLATGGLRGRAVIVP
jgi:NADPH2:quinone reductase